MISAQEAVRQDPVLYVLDSCSHFIRTVPTLPRDPTKLGDLDTAVEAHRPATASWK